MKLNNISIRTKLVLILAVTAISAIFLMTSAFVLFEVQSKKKAVEQELSSLAYVVGWNSSPALAFLDKRAAEQTLTVLKTKPEIVAAFLYDLDDQVFAQFNISENTYSPWSKKDLKLSRAYKKNSLGRKFNDGDPWFLKLKKFLVDRFFAPAITSGSLEYDDQGLLHMIYPVVLSEKAVGTIHLVNDLSKFKKELYTFNQIVIVILLLTFCVILWMSSRLQKVFSAPLMAFIQVMKSVADEKDYSIRVQKTGKDEFGQLTTAFNNMLGEIHVRDTELDIHRSKLEKQVVARTTELSEKNQELEKITSGALQAKEFAEKASHTKSDFLAMISHEIRTPMNGVLGMTELLIHSKLEDRQARLANTILRSANSLLGIINNILDFSKIEAGKLQLVMTDFDLRQLLEETLEALANQAHRKGLELILNLPSDLNCIVYGDSERIRQVLINLIGNAIKFTSSGEVQVQVTLDDSSPEKGKYNIEFSILDTGTGIELDQQQHVFDSFTQTDNSITRRFGGAGLGLPISRQLVQLMGSEIYLESIPGKGTCFYFTLTLEAKGATKNLNFDTKVLNAIKILVVDDNTTQRGLIVDQLRGWGARCTGVANSVRALAELKDASSQNDPYRIALLDSQMPDNDGMELASTIRNEPVIQHLFLIMLSSDTFSAEADQYSNLGISYYLNKPVFQRPLLNCLLRSLGVPLEEPLESRYLPVHQEKQIDAKILLAEDNVINQEVARSMLEEMGCEVHIVDTGLEAIEAVQRGEYDLILMDCHMPEMDGMQATKEIRVQESSKSKQTRIPIIAITADAQKTIRDQCIKAGMYDFLTKPYTREQLQQILEKYLPHKVIEESVGIHTQVLSTPQLIKGHPVLNSDALDQLRALHTSSGENLLNKTIALYIDSAPKEIAAMQQALDTDNVNELGKIAHRLKSASAIVGAKDLASTCESLEVLGHERIVKGVDRMLGVARDGMENVITALKQLSPMEEVRPKSYERSLQIKQNRILIVDDDPSFRLVTNEALRSAAFLVDEAESGLEAIKKVKKQLPDLLLLDAVMDGIDGFETCRKLRAYPPMADVPIIMVTGRDDLQSVNRAFEVGASDFIIKPLNYAVLIHRLKFIFRLGQNTAELKNSKQQLDAAQRIARLGYWNWNMELNKFTISSHLAALCKIEVKDFDGSLQGYLQLVHSQDRSYVKDSIRATIKDETDKTIEYRLLVADSSPIEVRQEMERIDGNVGVMVRGTVQDITQQKENVKKIHRLAYFDNLTGLASRAYYQVRIEETIKNAKRRDEQFAFLFLDLDGFKDVNDSFGHNVGDQFLKSIAARLKNVVRDIDFAARLGGDEFCIIVGNISDEYNAAEVADRCLEDINLPLSIESNQIKPRVSIGIAIFPKDGENEHDLMKAADAAMYAAKKAGKQRYAFYSPEMTSMAKKRLRDEQLLQTALDQEQFLLYYQPQISLQDRQIVGFEALIRWQHPDGDIVLPGEFISIAESLSLIDKVDEWVLHKACQQIVELNRSGSQIPKVAVNISARVFEMQRFPEMVSSALKQSGLPPEILELEVTESVIQVESNIEIFEKLKILGVRIAIDNFGTGFSSLSSLKELPADCLKVDSIFVQDVVVNSQSSLLLGTIFGLANALDYTLVAEGVETEQQALVMDGLGCQVAQGNFFSAPVSIEELPGLLNTDFSLSNSESA
jgi:diguanylate cyclase (GGDEF)-like protein